MLKATQADCYEEVRNYGKHLFIQSIVENGWCRGEMHLPHPHSLDPPLVIFMYLTEVRRLYNTNNIIGKWPDTRQDYFEYFGSYPHSNCASLS